MSKKVAYVTGGMGGIGTAICQRLHKEGFTVIAGCGPTRDFTKWLDEQKALGYTFHASVGNVGDWDSTVEAFTKTKAEHGSIDVLVNNAGITRDRMFLKMTREDWDQVISTNLTSVFHLSRAVLRGMMKARSGRIINITSVVGHAGNPGQMNYAAAKSGVAGMTRALAREGAGVVINYHHSDKAAAAHVALFAARLDAGEEEWGPATAARADLYAQAAFSDLEEQRRTAARASGADEEKRECGDDCHECAECREKAAFGWRPICTLPPAGDCPCATRCRCYFRFRAAGAPGAPAPAGG